MNNPTSYWNGCNTGTFNSLSELLKHVDAEHAFPEDQVHMPLMIKNINENGINLRKQHTGRESFFYQIFNSRPNKRSRHPLKTNALASTSY